jgi:hypothetical protein
LNQNFSYKYLNQLIGSDYILRNAIPAHNTLTYDKNGNLLSKTNNATPRKTTDYAHGLNNQLIHIVYPDEWHLEKWKAAPGTDQIYLIKTPISRKTGRIITITPMMAWR